MQMNGHLVLVNRCFKFEIDLNMKEEEERKKKNVLLIACILLINLHVDKVLPAVIHTVNYLVYEINNEV